MKLYQAVVSLCIMTMIVSAVGCGEHTDPRKNDATNKDTSKTSKLMENTINSKSGYLPVNGIKMYYEIHGTGDPLVLIHGGGSTIATSFEKILPLLAKSHKVIAVELQAHGHTSDRNAPESFEQDANDVAELLKQLDIKSADFLGFSNGGHTAMQLAISHPALIRKLIIASAFYKREGAPAQFWENMNHASFEQMPQQLKEGFLKISNDSTALLNMFHKDASRMQHFKGWTDEEIKSIKVPTLIIAADKDVILPEHAVEMNRMIPNSRLAILPGTHGTYLGEITTLVNGKWEQEYAIGLLEQFLGAKNR